MTEHVDVVVVGAGISGIGAAHHLLTRCPDRTFTILDGRDVRLMADGRETVLPLSTLQFSEADEKLFNTIGVAAPWTSPVIGDVSAGGAADRAVSGRAAHHHL